MSTSAWPNRLGGRSAEPTEAMRIAMAADHAGYRLKEKLRDHLKRSGHQVIDLGTHDETPVDYPPLCAAVGREVAGGRAMLGLVIGGSGQGEAIAANKVHGVRAALCLDEFTARLAREHNDANVLALGARVLADTFAASIVEVFLATPFAGGHHAPRLRQIANIESEECSGRV